MVRPYTSASVRLPRKEVKSIATIVAKDWAIVNGEYFIFTEEEKKWRREHRAR